MQITESYYHRAEYGNVHEGFFSLAEQQYRLQMMMMMMIIIIIVKIQTNENQK